VNDFLRDFPTDIIGAIAATGAGAWLLLKRLLLKSAIDTSAKDAVNAQGDVVQLLRDEVRRLGEINGELAAEVNKLQRQNMRLLNEIADLHTTINNMAEQINTAMRRKTDPQLGAEWPDIDRRKHS